MEPARNPLAAPEYLPKQNFVTSDKPNFDNVNFSDHQNRVSSARPVSGTMWGRNGERKMGKCICTAQAHNLVFRLLCQEFETKHGTVVWSTL
jgi:hypothetical protein